MSFFFFKSFYHFTIVLRGRSTKNITWLQVFSCPLIHEVSTEGDWGGGMGLSIQSVILGKRKSVEREGQGSGWGGTESPEGRCQIRFTEDGEQAQECVSSTEVYIGYLRPTHSSSSCTRALQASIQY